MNFRWNTSPDGVGLFDVILAILLAAGCGLGLRIYWWLFGTPLVRLWQWGRDAWHEARREYDYSSSDEGSFFSTPLKWLCHKLFAWGRHVHLPSKKGSGVEPGNGW